MEDTIKYLKDNVRHYRTRLKISQQKLAEECKVSTYYIAEIERGRKYPSLKTLIKLASIFEIPVYMLLIDSLDHESFIIDQYSQDLKKELLQVIENLQNRY